MSSEGPFGTGFAGLGVQSDDDVVVAGANGSVWIRDGDDLTNGVAYASGFGNITKLVVQSNDDVVVANSAGSLYRLSGSDLDTLATNTGLGTITGLARQTVKKLTLSQTDPTSHLADAQTVAVENNYGGGSARYDIPPPDVIAGSAFSDDIMNWPSATGWTAEFYNCSNEVFCLSTDQELWGPTVENAKIEMTTNVNGWVVLRPPSEMTINEEFNVVDCWLYGHENWWGTLTLTFRKTDDSLVSYTFGTEQYRSPGVLFGQYTMAHMKLPALMANGTKLVSMKIVPATTGPFLCHIDQMRMLKWETYLSGTAAPTYPNAGTPPTLPVNSNGACPSTTDSVTHTVSFQGNTGKLKYTVGGVDVTYVYTPGNGTLSDLTVTKSGMNTIKPADTSGPRFEHNGVTYTAGQAGVTATMTGKSQVGSTLIYNWTFTTANGTTHMQYQLSLSGKTLRLELSATESNVSHWLFGYASNLSSPKIVEIPFMSYSPNLLCSQNMFITYYTDWYKTNTSSISSTASNIVNGSIAYYTYSDPNYEYAKLTNGNRNPFHEMLYITVASKVEDCLLNISNPPSPYATELRTNLYRMVSPGSNWCNIARSHADYYASYGMTNLFLLFHATVWSYRGGEGPEPFHSRTQSSVATLGGDTAVTGTMDYLWSKGIRGGYYSGFNFYQPVSDTWDYNDVAWGGDGSWGAVHVQSYHMKPWCFAELANTRAVTQATEFHPKVIYEDGRTASMLHEGNDYDHRMTDAGKFFDTLKAVATGFNNDRAAVGGPVFGEGDGRNFYTAGLNDGDYGKLPGYGNGLSPAQNRIPLLVDFQLRKVHPLHSPVGLNNGYSGYDPTGGDYMYHYLATEIAYGCLGEVEPYGTFYWDPSMEYGTTMRTYFNIQSLQYRYVMQTVSSIMYYDGNFYLSPSEAILNDKYKDNKVFIQYANGLSIWVNGNWDNSHWMINPQGSDVYDLPPGGWYAKQGSDFVAYSIISNGTRLDATDGPEYTYIDPHGVNVTLYGLTTNKQVVRHNSGQYSGLTKYYPE